MPQMTAVETLAETEKNDPYWMNRKAGASALVLKGQGNAKYQPQYMSGNTSWQLANGEFVTEPFYDGKSTLLRLQAEGLKLDLTIQPGDTVRSYDFPDNPPERREKCFVAGVVQSNTYKRNDGVLCYQIRVTQQVFNGKPLAAFAEYATVPVNGTPTSMGCVTNGVVKVSA